MSKNYHILLIVTETNGRIYWNEGIISFDHHPFSIRKSQREFNANIWVNKWTNLIWSLESIHCSPCLPWIFFWKCCKANTFHIYCIRKHIDPFTVRSGCEISISIWKKWSSTSPISMTYPCIDFSVKCFIGTWSNTSSVIEPEIDTSESEYLNISDAATSCIYSGKGTSDSYRGIWICAYNPPKKGSSFLNFIYEIEICEGSRENVWSITDIFIVFIIIYKSVPIFITGNSSISISISIVVEKLKGILTISLVTSRIVHIRRKSGRERITNAQTSSGSYTLCIIYPTTTEIKSTSIGYSSTYNTTFSVISSSSWEHVMPTSYEGIWAISIPVFFKIQSTTSLDICYEIFRKKVEFLEEFHTIFGFDTNERHTRDGLKNGNHEKSKNRHTKHEFDEGKSATIFYQSRHFFEKSKVLAWW